ncbi:hypothetical protein KC19_12G072100 [Ceratodon purpureus]|uniref:Uncharacterized protein n=1 Tax=Ceratodon purpureus TaxID=3225 RepID=A0A8T0G5L2_CERPU|nr:hypothetical protein KC19_12G072100 [Ceratodon purpureus]
MSSILYQHEYGENSTRDDRFGGQPRWIERVIRVYELGPFGPVHDCLYNCDCDLCSKFRWLTRPVCTCKLGNSWRKFHTLDDAMRRKWITCRCEPSLPPWTGQICPCLLELPTQENDIATLGRINHSVTEIAPYVPDILEAEWICDLENVDTN